MRRRVNELDERLFRLEESIETMLASPKYASGGGAFNAQSGRKEIFADLVKSIKFDALVETGTFVGETAGFMHEMTRLPVHTCEVHRRNYLIAKMRLGEFPSINIELNDSRRFLRSLASQRLSQQTTFFYLDAHWYADLPLREEVEIIAEHWERSVIMVDDFRVPGDEGYLYDRYGRGRSLELDLIANTIRAHGLKVYFPSLPSSKESGRKSGCVVLVKRGPLSDEVSKLHSLREVL